MTTAIKEAIGAVVASWFMVCIWCGSDPFPEPDVPSVDLQIETLTGLHGVTRESGWFFDCSFGQMGNYAFSAGDAHGVLCTSIGGNSTIAMKVDFTDRGWWTWFGKYINGPFLPIPILWLFWRAILGRRGAVKQERAVSQ